MDKIDKATRSRVMASVHSKNTQPEIIVRSTLHRLGFRFRLHRKDLPGNPDIVLPSRKVAIFVHGCFWHGHNCPHGQRLPTSNVQYWREKISKNMERDFKTLNDIIVLGWRPIVIWECETVNADMLSKRLIEVIG